MILFMLVQIQLCRPRAVYICDGSEEEAEMITHKLVERGTLTKLTKYENCYICWTDPRVSEAKWTFSRRTHLILGCGSSGIENIYRH